MTAVVLLCLCVCVFSRCATNLSAHIENTHKTKRETPAKYTKLGNNNNNKGTMIGRGRERQPNRKSLRPQSQAGSSGRAIERQRKRERTSTACKQCLSALLSPDNCRSDTGAYYVFYYAFCARTTTTSRMGYSNNHRQSKKAEKQTQTQRPFCGQQQYSVQSDNSNNNSKVQLQAVQKQKAKSKEARACAMPLSVVCVCVCSICGETGTDIEWECNYGSTSASVSASASGRASV